MTYGPKHLLYKVNVKFFLEKMMKDNTEKQKPMKKTQWSLYSFTFAIVS